MIDWPTLTVAFFIGLLGGAHCIGMCGGIIGALSMSISVENYVRRFLIIVTYNVGRIVSYLLIAWLFYQLIHQLQNYFALQFMRYVAGILLIAMGLYLANWWRGLVYLEKAGSHLWRYIQPLSRTLLPVKSYPQAFFLGFIWGWLPCGLIYSALAYATTATNSFNAVLIMLAFAVGTLPAVMASGLLAERLLMLVKKVHVRQGFAVLIIVFGVWTLFNAVKHRDHHPQSTSTPAHIHYH
ncbi:MAG: sulfite exporter TauE/SafE [Candidatus Endobugula sp.]|jgi:sulfite exporter TauE/SafE